MIASLDQVDPVDQCGISVGDVKGIATGSIFNLFFSFLSCLALPLSPHLTHFSHLL
ncbi:hypothetical protein BDV41DRAFT_537664 [Aspergillus transmontanensis]|uniref:Uncharacterized protein n=1 Tax=Aspergillus transmontanensis TaxID=1034304 RepID=A0A5N6VXC4_9EURO|nr:hypothetical protein BDV41DRAFT_537664 [Aspergillus transmontanensis]